MENDFGKRVVLHLIEKKSLDGETNFTLEPETWLMCNKKGTINSTKTKDPQATSCDVLQIEVGGSRCLSQRTYKVHRHRQEAPKQKLNRPKGLRLWWNWMLRVDRKIRDETPGLLISAASTR